MAGSALIEYLEGEESIGEFLTSQQQPFFASTVTLSEVFVGAVRLRGEADLDEIEDRITALWSG